MAAQGIPQTLRFLLLPPEIRNQIYDHVFSSSTFTISEPEFGLTKREDSRQHKTSTNHDISLLYVCRQTYSETAVLPLKLSTFKIDSTNTPRLMYNYHVSTYDKATYIRQNYSLFTRQQVAKITSLYWKIPKSKIFNIVFFFGLIGKEPANDEREDLRLFFPGVKYVVWDMPQDHCSTYSKYVNSMFGLSSYKTYMENVEKWIIKSGEVEFEIRVSDE
jgi:hypothetical protein